MKNIYTFLLIIAFGMIIGPLHADEGSKTILSGKITDKKTGETLPGVNVYFPDLKIGTTTDENGDYRIGNLPAINALVQISYVGYRNIIEKLDLSVVHQKDFALEYVATEINEVVITGLSGSMAQKRNPAPVTVVPKQVLLQTVSSNIIDAISHQPGLSQVTTGNGISKPVIRGLGYNRVVVVDDGVRQEGQQWGDEHGIEIDEATVDRVEVLKGPASLAYGSDAMAGVINMLPAPTPVEGTITGNISANYQTNDGLFGLTADIAGNRNGFIWDARYSNKLAHSYQNRYDGYVFNSAFKQNSLYLKAGLVKSWGYTHLIFSAYNFTPGIVEGERDSLTGKFTREVALNSQTEGSRIATNKELKSYEPVISYQKIHHYKAVWNSSFILGKSSINTAFGFQQNQRQEFGNILQPDQYGLFLLLNTTTYDLRYILPERNNWSVSFGVNGMAQNSVNKGTEYLVPDYSLFDAGIFSIVKKTIGKIDFLGGLRYDSRHEHGKELLLNADGEKIPNPETGYTVKFPAFRSTFSGFSGSVGATWQISRAFYSKLNLSRGYRAPNIAELGANGIHEGTFRYEIGDPHLHPENSFQVDFAGGLTSEHISAEIDIFNNQIQHYIFSRKLNNTAGGDSLIQNVEAFRYVSGNARLYGGEIRLDIHPHPLDWIHFENSFSYVRGIQINQPDSTRNLPMIPAPRIQSTLRFNLKQAAKVIRNGYFEVGLEHDFVQNKFYRAFHTETQTPGYTLWNLGVGGDLAGKNRVICSVSVNISNLTDTPYQSHLSRLKYGPENFNTGRMGIYNMGRNVSFRISIPISLHQPNS